ncbi:ribonuclease Z [Alicyclobacillaceae bacterium I2511]|nr:ribonuclease Z [Alicyclobacillaceae bacterium I2511]
MDLYFLGTSAGVPTKTRNVSALAFRVLTEQGNVWLFDCGEGTQQQILSAPIKLSKINKVFITHLHGDHLFGLPGLLSSRSLQGIRTPLTLFGPKGLQGYVDTCLATTGTHLVYSLEIVELPVTSPGDQTHPFLVWSDEQFQVEAARLEHRIPSFGYRVSERPTRGHLNTMRLSALGVLPGPSYGLLQRGERLTLPDGRQIDPEQFRDPPRPGRVITILGDTRPCSNTIELARNADLLIHEATFANEHQQLALAYHHSTAAEAAKTAIAAGAQQLVLTHISSRYQGPDLEQLLADAQTIFSNSHLAADGWSIEIPPKVRKTADASPPPPVLDKT